MPARATSTVIASLRTCPPLPEELAHVKRARKSAGGDGGTTDVVLKARTMGGGASALEDARGCEATRTAVLERHADVVREVAFVSVPKEAPSDREAWKAACEVWPVSLMTSTEREAETVTELEAAYFWKWTKRACASAPVNANGGCGNCAIIVDPSRDEEVARGVDESRAHPLRHAAMCAVDLAAKLDVEKYPEKEHVEAFVEARRVEKLERDRERAEFGDDKKRKREKASGAAVIEFMGRPYLCTGYDVFLAREPCVMCAMALVHSRLKRVIFAAPDDVNGALNGPSGSRRLHGVQSLNHHYLVYSFDLNEDDLRAIREESN